MTNKTANCDVIHRRYQGTSYVLFQNVIQFGDTRENVISYTIALIFEKLSVNSAVIRLNLL